VSTAAALDQATALRRAGRHADAIGLLEGVTREQPGSAEAWTLLGSSCFHLNHFDRARRALERTVVLAPEFVEAWMVLGNARVNQGDIGGAMAAFDAAHRLQPDSDVVASSRLFYMGFHPDAYLRLPGESMAWGAQLERTIQRLPAPGPRARDGERLRIGYFSHEFGAHVTSYFFEPVISRHDRTGFEFFLYGGAPDRDAVSRRIAEGADHWRDIGGLDARAAAELVRADAIDILVLVSSYRAVHRRPLAYKPAPIQVCYCNLVSTSGLAAVDYLVTEEDLDPTDTADPLYVEKLVRLTTCKVYNPPPDCPPVAARPADAPVVFGSFNNIGKITPATAALWGRVLARVPGARLLVKNIVPMAESADWNVLKGVLAGAGVPLERVTVLDTVPSRTQHLQAYGEMDIALDPFPFNGGTTSCDALWMGVPIVARHGETFVARQSSTILKKLGLADLVAGSNDAYVEIAVALAHDAARRRRLRQDLRPLMETRLLDYDRHVRELEAAYRLMWKRHAAGLPPERFSVRL
jgi:predicted O-linked N-acetylglucosamine transferase (SPINDLY family)